MAGLVICWVNVKIVILSSFPTFNISPFITYAIGSNFILAALYQNVLVC